MLFILHYMHRIIFKKIININSPIVLLIVRATASQHRITRNAVRTRRNAIRVNERRRHRQPVAHNQHRADTAIARHSLDRVLTGAAHHQRRVVVVVSAAVSAIHHAMMTMTAVLMAIAGSAVAAAARTTDRPTAMSTTAIAAQTIAHHDTRRAVKAILQTVADRPERGQSDPARFDGARSRHTVTLALLMHLRLDVLQNERDETNQI